jgi:hypothetical protein
MDSPYQWRTRKILLSLEIRGDDADAYNRRYLKLVCMASPCLHGSFAGKKQSTLNFIVSYGLGGGGDIRHGYHSADLPSLDIIPVMG